MEWKSVLYEYVHKRNQADADGTAEGFESCLDDERFLAFLEERAARQNALNKERKLRILEKETRLRLLEAKEEDGAVTAEIELRGRSRYEIAGRLHTEERADREHVVLSNDSGKWTIVSVSVETPESASADVNVGGRDRSDQKAAAAQLERTAPQAAARLPYLNSQLLDSSLFAGRAVVYDRAKAAAYADKWWNSPNPQYLRFDVDCTNFVSQCLFAGGAPMHYTETRDAGWWYHGKSGGKEFWSYSWAVAHSLMWHLAGERKIGLRAVRVDSPAELVPGDIVSYDFGGTGRFGHSAIVTEIAADGMPLVNARSVECRKRYWDYSDSYAWSGDTKYRFFHISDTF